MVGIATGFSKNVASRKFFALAVTASLVFIAPLQAFAQDKQYLLGTADKLRIRVAEWQPADGTIRNWEVINGDYSVGASGSLSLPFIGQLDVAGKTTGQVGEEIGAQLQSKFALRNLPSASVEISQFRPVFLTGDVQTPGEYPYAPNLTVLKAVSLSGGLRRSDAGQRFARDFINARGDAAVYDDQRGRLLARQARLQAEVRGDTEIAKTPALENILNIDALLESENALMKSRSERYTLQLKALTDLRQLLETEVESLQKKSETQNRQLQLANEDKEKVNRLNEQGLALAQRRISAEERAAEVESTLLDIDTSSLRAKQDINKAMQDEINLRNDWVAQRSKELQDTEAELQKLNLQLGTSRELISEALAQSAEAIRFDPSGKSATITYVIVREQDGTSKEIKADETTSIQPGDVIKVSSDVLMQ
ncbi:polysaccharide biosynthesis/export family protein [Agrobacterium rosae]|uniref:Polysaccharide biosynthesis/export family protein n=1 Tax=Agrobacterium rosae TaxID=1972867 RepID=A0AAE5RX31_9HYPH|nr:polysaccharide biosynthesis/export family protein [Agrobacterium rosae]KAA3515969.1 sugar ABC transporter substrate-binding protein [Agrobacterium rosae]KAA3524924.1 sugar ABC transporter substrate-binding protein [Agrobacterium rosae]MCM2431380.1 sugar ABC transporter substrate-binding protein [Agrobacterium rosae]MDX8328954.1 polysaccharide biosynthesis/export family protein [Agrobacterium rosae]MQB46830.1 sugar ABC transporter substrate-binding protein [Agrobacterium rosae]